MWYVIQVIGGQEHVVIQEVEKLVNPETYKKVFIPQYEVKKKFGGAWKNRREILFPGYVFVETKTPRAFVKELHKTSRMAKVLHDGSEHFIPLAAEEKTTISAFLDGEDHVMKMSEGIIEGDQILILKGPLMNHTGLVKKIDRHKRLAYLEIYMCSRQLTIKAGLEIVKKN